MTKTEQEVIGEILAAGPPMSETQVDAALQELERRGSIERTNPGETPARFRLTAQGLDETADLLIAHGAGDVGS